MAAICHTPIQGTAMRVTRLDACGSVVTGSCSTVVADGFISVEMTDDVEDEDLFQLRSTPLGCGVKRKPPLLNWIDVKIKFCVMDPDLLGLVSGSPVLTNAGGSSVGFATEETDFGTADFALEVWTNVAGSTACLGGTQRYGYLLLPWVGAGVIEDLSVANEPLEFTVKAATVSGNRWGTGRYNVVTNGAGVASQLSSAIPIDRHRHWQLTEVAPPAATCGCTALS